MKNSKINPNNIYTLKEICKIMKIKLPKEFKNIANIKRDNITLKKEKVTKGAVFFAGYDEIDNKEYYDNIISLGAEIIFIDKSNFDIYQPPSEYPVIVVDNLLEKQGRFFAHVRRKYKLKTLAITGSVGKTTTKQLLEHVVSKEFNTYCSKGNYNSFPSVANHIMYELNQEHEVFIQESGAAAPGSVEKGAAMLEPDAYILTNVLPHHLNYYKTVENVLKDKTSFNKYLKRKGVVVTNYDDELICKTKFPRKVISYGIYTKEKVDYRAINIKQNKEFLEFDIKYEKNLCHVKVNIVGKHNAYNILAAFALSKWLGIEDEKITKHMLDFKTKGIRQNIMNIGGITFYIDCYNVCNTSIKAGIETLEEMEIAKGNKKIAILGGENKLGKDYKKITYQLGKEIKDNKLDHIICYSLADKTQKSIDYYGESKPIYEALKDSGYKNVSLIQNKEELTKTMKEMLTPGDIVLIKGNAELDMTVVIDKIFGTSLTMDYEYKPERNKIVENEDFKMKANEDFKAGVLTECKKKESELINLVIPNEIEGYSVYKIKSKLFRENNYIEKVEFNSKIVNIGFAAFARCENINELNIPSNVKWIGASAFANCTNLKEVVINEGTINISKNAFYNCRNLEKIVLPSSIKYIDDLAFEKATNLTIICEKGSYAEEYAKTKNISVKYNN